MPDAPAQSNIVDPELKQRVASLYASMARRLGVKAPPRIVFTQNAENAREPFGKTAYYDPANRVIRVYVTERHPTDILRSFAHELIHHWQNEHGALPNSQGGQEHYAQKDPVLRRREMEAYLMGNILFRDWQDENRYGKLNENLQITDGRRVMQAIKETLFQLIKDNAIRSYHRKLTSGDMDPNDFVEELARNLELHMEKFINTVNDRGNWENQPMVAESKITRSELQALINERIEKLLTEVDFEDEHGHKLTNREKKKRIHIGKPKPTDDDAARQERKQNYAQWLKQYLSHQEKQKKEEDKYYEIGFPRDRENFSDENHHYCWYWNPVTKEVVYMKGGDHSSNFGKKIPYGTFRGRYDLDTHELSLTIPHFGAMDITKDMEKDVPAELLSKLKQTFKNPKIHYFPFVV